MKISIRQGMFETNSSSMHSMCILKKGYIEEISLKEIQDSFWSVKGGVYELGYCTDDLDFERSPFQLLRTFSDKARYVVASLGEKGYNEVVSVLKEKDPNFRELVLPTKDSVKITFADGEVKYDDPWFADHYIQERDGVLIYDDVHNIRDRKVTSYEDVEVPYYGHVDHQSAGLLDSFLNNENKSVTLKDFLLSNRYIVVIDSDEYDEWSNIVKSGVVDINNVLLYDGFNSDWYPPTKERT